MISGEFNGGSWAPAGKRQSLPELGSRPGTRASTAMPEVQQPHTMAHYENAAFEGHSQKALNGISGRERKAKEYRQSTSTEHWVLEAASTRPKKIETGNTTVALRTSERSPRRSPSKDPPSRSPSGVRDAVKEFRMSARSRRRQSAQLAGEVPNSLESQIRKAEASGVVKPVY